MNHWFIAITSYIVIWWTVLFAILPFGVQRNENPEPGHDIGAPLHARMGKKAIWTSIVSALIWLILYALIKNGTLEQMIQWIGPE